MGAVYFYHLTRRPLEAVLPQLLERSLGQGWRVAIRAPHQDRLRRLDEQLWLCGDESFLPHGLEGTGFDAEQLILLTSSELSANAANCVMAVDGAALDASEIEHLDRACILFDGNDPDALAKARGQWKALTAANVSAQYWSEESGRWEKKAES